MIAANITATIIKRSVDLNLQHFSCFFILYTSCFVAYFGGEQALGT